jgi:hypothetical protein
MTMNGRAVETVGPPIQLGDFLPERRQVVINGQTYNAWVTTNRRYPRSIMARLDKAARTYNRVIAPIWDPLPEGQEPDEARLKAAEDQPEAWAAYVCEAVIQLVPGVTESDLDLIDTDTLAELLTQLGYFKPPAAAVDALTETIPGADTPGEVTAEGETPSTGDSSPESSADSTPATELTSS